MFEKVRPLGDRVLIKCMESEERTESGLYIPESAKEKPQRGIIVAVGTGRRDKDGKHIPLDVKVNDLVYYSKYAGTQASDEYLIIREEEILGVFDK